MTRQTLSQRTNYKFIRPKQSFINYPKTEKNSNDKKFVITQKKFVWLYLPIRFSTIRTATSIEFIVFLPKNYEPWEISSFYFSFFSDGTNPSHHIPNILLKD